MSEAECRDLLATCEVGRIVLSLQAMPVALPVAYRLLGPDIVFRSAPGSKLTAAATNTVVGFEVDQLDSNTRSGWSVLVIGMSRLITSPDEIAGFEQTPIPEWLPGPPHYVAIATQRISGRRLAATYDPAGVSTTTNSRPA